ncbi:hypothetical protein MPSEU_000055000 [Mayamaea pseudoterrestris]|nr:hypothetical protein MPSEU_000055000 [Mayamaea pseudoterrestris]
MDDDSDDDSDDEYYYDETYLRRNEKKLSNYIQRVTGATPPTAGSQLKFLTGLLQDNKQRRATAWIHHVERLLKDGLRKLADGVKIPVSINDDYRYSNLSDFLFTNELLIILTRQPHLKERFLAALREQSTKMTTFAVTFDNVLNLIGKKLAALTIPHSMDLIVMTTAIGQILGSFPHLETMLVLFNGAADQRTCIINAQVVLGCRQVKRLVLQPTYFRPESLAIFSDYIQGHPCLEDVEIAGCGEEFEPHEDIFEYLIRPLAFVKQLKAIKINCRWIEINLHEAEIIRNVLKVETLLKADLQVFDLNEEAIDTICTGLAESNLKKLTAAEWTYPEHRCASVVQALTSSKLVELSFNDDSSATCNALSLKLTSSACCLEILRVGITSAGYLAALLQHGLQWSVPCLHLVFDDSFVWTEDCEIAFALYVANNSHLRRLILTCTDFHRHGSRMAGMPILEAFGSGVGRLDELEIVDGDGKSIGNDWALTLKKHAGSNLNRHRRRAGAMFAAAMQAESAGIRRAALVKGLFTVNASARFAFLSNNELMCRRVLLEEMELAMVGPAE